MIIDPSKASSRDLYSYMTRLITPRPIAWVSTRSLENVDNIAPFSYFNAVGTSPPLLMFCPANKPNGEKKDTLRNIERTGEFVVNIVSASSIDSMNQTAAEYDPEESEFDHCGLMRRPSTVIATPGISEAQAAFECKLHSVLLLGAGPGGANMVIGRIVAIHIDEQCIDPAGQISSKSIDTLGRMGGSSYAYTRDQTERDRPRI